MDQDQPEAAVALGPRDRVEEVDYTQHWWRCLNCTADGTEPSRPEAMAASIKHMREAHGIDGLPTSGEIDDAVDRWHDGDGLGMELHEYLGWSWEDYGRWVQDPKAIPGPLRIWP